MYEKIHLRNGDEQSAPSFCVVLCTRLYNLYPSKQSRQINRVWRYFDMKIVCSNYTMAESHRPTHDLITVFDFICNLDNGVCFSSGKMLTIMRGCHQLKSLTGFMISLFRTKISSYTWQITFHDIKRTDGVLQIPLCGDWQEICGWRYSVHAMKHGMTSHGINTLRPGDTY